MIFSIFYIPVSVHHKSIIYNKPTRCNSGSIVFINNCRYNLLETVKLNKYIGHRLQGVLYKIQQDDMFRST